MVGFLVDENLPLSLIAELNKFSFNAKHILELNLRGYDDLTIANYAKKHQLILITKDLDFGNLILYPKGSHYGVLILRLFNLDKTKIFEILGRFLKEIKLDELINSITIVEKGRYRIRKL